MKRIKRLGALLLVLGLCAALAGLTVPRAADDGYIRMTNVVQISDKELLIEFSEPIAFNVNNVNRGPFVCIRFVNKSDTVVWLNNDSKTKQAIQWQGSISTLRNDRSKLVFGCFPVVCSHHILPDGTLLFHIYTAYSSCHRVVFSISILYAFALELQEKSAYLPQQYLYFFPLPQGHGSFLPTFLPITTVPDFFCSK